MNLESTVTNVFLESVNIPIITKFIVDADENSSGLTKDELFELSKTLPPKLKSFKQPDVIAALDSVLLNPATGIRGRKTKLQQIILDEIDDVLK
jgi:hypothetical protein